MRYLLKEEYQGKYKNSYIADKLSLSKVYVSMILNRKRPISKYMAYAFTKVVDINAEVEDLFESVK